VFVVQAKWAKLRRMGKRGAGRPSSSKANGATDAHQGFRVHRAFTIILGIVGGLMFAPLSLAWPLDLLRGGSVTDGAEVMIVVTAVGCTGLAFVARFIVRPRLVLTGDELHENRLFRSIAIPLSAVTSIDRVAGRIEGVKPKHVDTLYLFRGHPEKPWVVDLGFVDEPTKFMAALSTRCQATQGHYTPRNAPPWARG